MTHVASCGLFSTDEPLPAPRMIGRGEDVDELVAQQRGGIHRILAAPRRTGKSTVCQAAIARLAGDGLYTVSLSLFELTSAASLAERMAQRTLANRGALARLIERVRAEAELHAGRWSEADQLASPLLELLALANALRARSQ